MDQTDVTDLIERIRREFVALPGLRLTVPQAARLLDTSSDVCRSILETLVGSHFLEWRHDGLVARADLR
jgi:hypothetical protein